jgi:hypothetical protein
LIKEGRKVLMKVIYELVLKIWEKEIIPQERKYGIVCQIYKKGT